MMLTVVLLVLGLLAAATVLCMDIEDARREVRIRLAWYRFARDRRRRHRREF